MCFDSTFHPVQKSHLQYRKRTFIGLQSGPKSFQKSLKKYSTSLRLLIVLPSIPLQQWDFHYLEKYLQILAGLQKNVADVTHPKLFLHLYPTKQNRVTKTLLTTMDQHVLIVNGTSTFPWTTIDHQQWKLQCTPLLKAEVRQLTLNNGINMF